MRTCVRRMSVHEKKEFKVRKIDRNEQISDTAEQFPPGQLAFSQFTVSVAILRAMECASSTFVSIPPETSLPLVVQPSFTSNFLALFVEVRLQVGEKNLIFSKSTAQ